MAQYPARYFRLANLRSSGEVYINIARLEFREVAGVAQQATGGTSSARTVYGAGYEASKAFDNNPATSYNSAINDGAGTGWIQYVFASNRIVAEIFLQCFNNAPSTAQVPTEFQLQQSVDGVTWDNVGTPYTSTGWAVSESRTFAVDTSPAATSANVSADLPFADVAITGDVDVLGSVEADLPFADFAAEVTPGPAPRSPVKHYRLALMNGATNDYVSVSELQFRSNAGVAEVHSGGVAYAGTQFSDTYSAAKAFDNNTTTFHSTALGPLQSQRWLRYSFPIEKAVRQISIRGTAAADQSPASFEFQQSVDGTTWTAVQSWTGIIWATNETKLFNISSPAIDPVVVNADLPFADFDAEVDVTNAGIIDADLPFADFDVSSIYVLSGSVEADLPFADFDALFNEGIKGDVAADLPFADFDVSGNVTIVGTVDADLPFADFDALVAEIIIGTVDADLPFADFNAETDGPLAVDVSADLPFADFNAEVSVTIYGTVTADLPFADFSARESSVSVNSFSQSPSFSGGGRGGSFNVSSPVRFGTSKQIRVG